MDSIWNTTLFNIQQTPINLIKIFLFIAIILFSYFFGRWGRNAVQKGLSYKAHVHPSSSYAIGQVSYIVILVVGIYIALTILGINLTGIAVVAGALSVGFGFGFQTIVSNFVSGMIILTEKTVAPGDMVQIESGEVGTVLRVNIRSTLVEMSDHRKMVIPNTEIVTKKLINWSQGKEGAFPVTIPFAVSRGVAKEIVSGTVLKTVELEQGRKNENPPKVRLTKMTEKLQEWELTLWVQKNKKELKGFFQILEDNLAKEGIVIESMSFPNALAFLNFHGDL